MFSGEWSEPSSMSGLIVSGECRGRLATRVSSHQSIPAILSHTHFKQQLSSVMSSESLVSALFHGYYISSSN